MAPKFGTSGLRGRVTDLTDDLVAAYTRAFLSCTPGARALYIGRDLRPSSPRLAAAVGAAARAAGIAVRDVGEAPTPALAMAAMAAGAPAVMVTGSHIPADRNGLKFYTAEGEITKADESAILAALPAAGTASAPETGHAPGAAQDAVDARTPYLDRYRDFFGAGALQDLRIGVYEHSSVARDMLCDLLGALGADPVRLDRSEVFVPVDTEAVAPALRARIGDWTRAQGLDALISTDGDADRPLVAGPDGALIAGDILGVLTASALGAGAVVTPVSSNSLIEGAGLFGQVVRTRIGSPHVIAAMAALSPADRPVGFEANGGFLLGFAAEGPFGTLAPLVTRDAFLPALAPLVAARRAGTRLDRMIAALPRRRTASDRLQDIPTAASAALVARLSDDAAFRADLFAALGPVARRDHTDGLRLTFAGGEIVHLRPSGNAPELRCYAEADSEAAAAALVRETLARISALL